MKVHRFKRLGKLLTVTYWRCRLALWWSGNTRLEIKEVVIGEISEEEMDALAANDLDTTDYVLING